MPLNEAKVLEVIVNNVEKIDARYPEYRSDITELVATVITLEREHELVKSNIKGKIADQINLAGRTLYGFQK
jgi:hypothetical protein